MVNQQVVRVIISMQTNTCVIYEPSQQLDSKKSSSPLKFIEETSFIPKECSETKRLVQNANSFKKKIPAYDDMLSHFSFK